MRVSFCAWLPCLAVLVASSTASAFCRTNTCGNAGIPCTEDPATRCAVGGKDLAWPGACVSFSLQKDASKAVSLEDATQAATAAFATWAEAACDGGGVPSISAENKFGPAECAKVEYSQSADQHGNANIIMFRDDEWPHSEADKTIALTTVQFSTETGEIVDADMEINGQKVFSVASGASSGIDLQSILTHEAGHFLGLNHSLIDCRNDRSNACPTMHSQYTSDDFRTLKGDDIEAICTAYPPDRQVACDFTPRYGFASDCKTGLRRAGCSMGPPVSGGTGAGSLAVLAGSLAWLARGKRRRR